MTTLILVRHGESVTNKKCIFSGHFNADLEDKGVMQAKKTAEFLHKNYKVDAVYASDLLRAFKTGKEIADIFNLPLKTDEGLREVFAGKWEGVEFETVKNTYKEDYRVWLEDIGNSRCTDGESVREMTDRFLKTLEKIAKENDGKTVVIATHATPVRAVQTLLCHGSLEEMKNVKYVTNASVSVIEYENGSFSPVVFGMDEHMGDIRSGLPENV